MREGWKEYKLGHVLEKIIGGGTPSKSNEAYWNGDIPWCSVKDMSDDRFLVSSTEDMISEIGLKKSSANLIPKNTVVTATRMGLGRAFITGCDMAINQDLKALIPNSKIDNKFLLWLLITNRGNLDNLGTGSTVKGIRLETLKNIDILLPPLPTQRKIASILSAYDDLIENNLKRINLLEEKAQLTYEEWFVRMKFPGHETVKVDEETGLPEGWEKVKLSQIAEFLNGYAFKPKDLGENGMPVIKIKEMKNGVVGDTPRNSGKTVPKKYLVEKGDILFSWSATLEVVIWKFETGLLNQHLFKVTPNIGFGKSFVFLANKNSLQIFDGLTTGATMKHIKRKELDFVELNKPPKYIMDEFEAEVYPAIENVLNLSTQNRLLKEARDILLPRLMSGVVDVGTLI